MIGLGGERERKNREGKKGKGKKERRKREKGKEYDEAIVNPRNRRNRRNRPKQDSRRAPSVEELNAKRKKEGEAICGEKPKCGEEQSQSQYCTPVVVPPEFLVQPEPARVSGLNSG
jgi:hypothetical protein